ELEREIAPATVVASNSRLVNPASAPVSIPSALISPRRAATSPAEPAPPPPRPVVRQPETPASLAKKAEGLAAAGNYQDALEAYESAIDIDRTYLPALLGRGSCLTRLNRKAEALEVYKGILRQKIEEVRVDVPGLLSRALIASASGNYTQALSLFDDILEVEPSNVNALIGKAVAYRRSGKPQEAVNCLDLVLGVQPNNASA